MQITKRHLAFLDEAKAAFEANPRMETYWNDADLIALRYGPDRDCIRIFELGEEVAFFAQMMKPEPLITAVRKEVRWFAGEMERQLIANEDKDGWLHCHSDWLKSELYKNYSRLMSATDHDEIIRRCANIANFSMMIADRMKQPWHRTDPV